MSAVLPKASQCEIPSLPTSSGENNRVFAFLFLKPTNLTLSELKFCQKICQNFNTAVSHFFLCGEGVLKCISLKHKNGNYYIYFEDEFGRRKSITTKTKLKSEATKFLSEFKVYLKQRKESKTVSISIQHFITKFLIYSSHIHSENHTKSLRTTLIKLLEYSGNCNLNELNKQKVISFIEWRLSKVSNRAVKRDIANLSLA